MTSLVKGSPDLDKAIRAFLELGDGRNMLAHQNFAAFAMQKTSEEIYKLYQDAMPFIETVRSELRVCSRNLREIAAAKSLEEQSQQNLSAPVEEHL